MDGCECRGDASVPLQALGRDRECGAVREGGGGVGVGPGHGRRSAAKHCIKRVWRLFRNEQFETESLFAALFRFLRPPTGRTIVLMDWTDLHPFQQWFFSFPRDGRALPFLAITIRKGTTEEENPGAMVQAERQGWEMLARICPPAVRPILIADRGFGHPRWLEDIPKRGWAFVQRLSQVH